MGWIERYQRSRRAALARDGIGSGPPTPYSEFQKTRWNTITRLRAAYHAGTILREDAEPVFRLLWRYALTTSSQAKIQRAIEAANWLADPKREILTPAETKRVAGGRPRHLTPLERLHLL
jgi:hypothetical protein